MAGANTKEGDRQRTNTRTSCVLGYTFSGANDDASAEGDDGELEVEVDDAEEDLEEINPPQLAAKRSQETLFV